MDAPHVRLHSVQRDVELAADLALREPGRKQPQHCELARAELVAEGRVVSSGVTPEAFRASPRARPDDPWVRAAREEGGARRGELAGPCAIAAHLLRVAQRDERNRGLETTRPAPGELDRPAGRALGLRKTAAALRCLGQCKMSNRQNEVVPEARLLALVYRSERIAFGVIQLSVPGVDQSHV